MGPPNYTLLEMLAEERQRELRDEFERLHLIAVAPKPQRTSLRGAMADRVHALSIKAYTPDEWVRVQ